MFHKISLFNVIMTVIAVTGCAQAKSPILDDQPKSTITFNKVESFLKSERNLRKWDAPVVADLDQDGFPDLLLNDHGFSVKIVWNNAGNFSAPYDLIMGDMHGISVADYDKDGLQEVIIARGGGSGSNARNSVIFKIDKQRKISQLADFDEPLAYMRGRTVKFVDLDKDGDPDLLNFAFPSQEKKGESENYLYENRDGQNFTLKGMLPKSARDGQKVLLSDFNNDGFFDIFMYGHKNIKVYQGAENFEFKNVTQNVFPASIADVTSMLEFDYDNDGDMDIFITRGEENSKGQTFYNANTKTLGLYTKRGPFDFVLEDVGDVLNISNLQSQWPDTSLNIGESGYKYEFPGDTHSGRDIRLVNSDALGFPQTLDKKGAYIGYIGNKKWRIAGNIWSPFTAVIEGIPHYDATAPQPGLTNILLENQQGVFVDKTERANLAILEHSTGSATGDINNDGFQDLVVMRRGNLVEPNKALIFLNSVDGTFQEMQQHNVVTSELGSIGLGVELLDFDLDGKLDILIGNERGKWHLFKNKLDHQMSAVTLKIGDSLGKKASALGAKVEITHCDLRQTKTLGATAAAYSLSFNTFVHFGIGDCSSPIHATVTWTTGEVQKVTLQNDNAIQALGHW